MAPTKKLKPSAPPKTRISRIFQPFRAMGFVTTDVPFCLQMRGTEYFITVSVGKSFQIYDAQKLKLKFVSQPAPSQIQCIVANGNDTFVACGSEIIRYNRAKKIGTLKSDTDASINQLLIFGGHLIASHQDNVMRVWDLENDEVFVELPLGSDFTVTTVVHPSTYVNKILVGSREGVMQLWNLRTQRMLYAFSKFNSPITCMEQSPVVDIVAIGLLDGTTILHNIRTDKRIATFSHEGRVTAITFRTDQAHIMATGSSSGEVALWDLNERRLSHVMKDAHEGSVSALKFLNGQPILISSAADNSIKEWIFDNLDGTPRILRSRSGHYGTPTFVRFYDDEGKYLLSVGRDRALRLFCTIRDEQNIELSQGSLTKKAKSMNMKTEELKLPFPVQFSAMPTKQRDWDNILTCHQGHNVAKTWTFERKAIGAHELKSSDGSIIRCTAISACGNFGLVGCSSGRVDIFNMQSGRYQRSLNGHTKSVTGIAIDAVNRKVITASIDGTVKIWDFRTKECLNTIDVGVPAQNMTLQLENDLLALSGDDLSIRVIDIDTAKVVRVFNGHNGRITDLCFSPDGRWIVSCGLDSTIRTWDLPSGHMVDIFRAESVPTSISFSPRGDFVATTHVNSVGIYLWANRLQFSHVALKGVSVDEDEELEVVGLPTIEGETHETEEVSEDADDGILYHTPEQIVEGMITLSMEPKSKWKNLLNLETIKKRNRPKEAPKVPEKAPFFLPTLAGLEPKFDVRAPEKNDEGSSRILKFGDIAEESEFMRQIKMAVETTQYESVVLMLKSMSPAALDLEIRSINVLMGFEDLVCFLKCMNDLIKSHKQFELFQACLNVVLNVHGDVVYQNAQDFKPILTDLETSLQGSYTKLDPLFQQSLCLIDFIRNAI